MISRKTARLLAEAYDGAFSRVTVRTVRRVSDEYRYAQGIAALPESAYETEQVEEYRLLRDELYEFLYDEEYENWFVWIFRELSNLVNKRILKERLMGLHTGEIFTHFPGPYREAGEEERRQAGQKYITALAASLFRLRDRDPGAFTPRAEERLQRLRAHLELDGYVYGNGRLYPVDGSVIDEQEEQGYLEYLISNAALNDKATVLHHLKLAEEDYVEGRWGNSISNSRNFLEAILSRVAESIHAKKYGASPDTKDIKRPVWVRDFLAQEGFLSATEKEAVARIYGLISETGSHPNMAEKDHARLMRHLALTFSQFILLRYENNP